MLSMSRFIRLLVLFALLAFVAVTCAQRREQYQIHALIQKLHRSVREQPVSALRMHAADVVFKFGCMIDRERLIEEVPRVDPLAVWKVGVFGNHQRS